MCQKFYLKLALGSSAGKEVVYRILHLLLNLMLSCVTARKEEQIEPMTLFKFRNTSMKEALAFNRAWTLHLM